MKGLRGALNFLPTLCRETSVAPVRDDSRQKQAGGIAETEDIIYAGQMESPVSWLIYLDEPC